jgi:antitoxin component YwqK of YwqJK toxin-antitoxin module
MKKIMMMIAMLAMTAAMQAQTKFHDVEANEAKGPVKTMTMDMMGMSRTINFTEDGKMQSAEMSDAVYDENGYIKSAKMSVQGQSATMKFEWENGRLKSQTINVMGQDIKTIHNYDENGLITSESIDMGGQMMESPYTDYKFDDHGNWISRKTSMMGQEMTTTRSFTYY